jgi:hypothetical protein
LNPDAMNKFQKADEARAAKRRQSHGVTKAEAVAARDKVREQWTSHGHSENQGRNGGLLLDVKTLEAKNAAQADRRKITTPPALTTMTEKSMTAIVERWAQETNFYASQFNMTSLVNRLRRDVDAGVPFSYEMLSASCEWLKKNNHVEQPPTTVRKRGEIVSSAVPTLYEYVTADEQAAINADDIEKAAQARQREDAANRTLSLEELRQKADAARGTISREAIRIFQG